MTEQPLDQQAQYYEDYKPKTHYNGLLSLDNRIIGTASLTFFPIARHLVAQLRDTDPFYFNRLLIHPSSRGKGFGSILLDNVIEFFQENQLSISCELNPYGRLSKQALRELYLRHGFEYVSEDTVIFIPSKLEEVQNE